MNGGAASGQLVPVTLTGGTLNVNTAEAVSLPSVLLAGGTLGGTAAVTVTGGLDVTATSFLSGTGVLTTLGATSVSMAAGGGILGVMGGKSWVNKGTLTIGSDERLLFGYFTGGFNSLTNAAGGTIELASSNATPLDFYTGSGSITNLGTLNQSAAGSHGISGSLAFNNGGAVNVDTGTLVIGGGGTDTDVYAVDAGAALNFSGGTRNFDAGSDISGPGQLIVSGATVNASVPLSLAASDTALLITAAR